MSIGRLAVEEKETMSAVALGVICGLAIGFIAQAVLGESHKEQG
jgi:hypothetical protein